LNGISVAFSELAKEENCFHRYDSQGKMEVRHHWNLLGTIELLLVILSAGSEPMSADKILYFTRSLFEFSIPIESGSKSQ
jgi:hypothetical protein